jgi:hypothetical protein
MIRSTMRAAVTEACLIGMTTLVGLAASAFEGVWKVKDTAGRPFEEQGLRAASRFNYCLRCYRPDLRRHGVQVEI